MDDLDLSEIDPLKWAEVRRRADAVKEYLSLNDPSAADRERLGATLNIGAHQFANLIKAWVAQRDASVFAPGLRSQRQSRSKRGGVDPRAREIARKVIAEIGADARISRLVEIVGRRCAAVGVAPPSRSSLWLLASESRSKGADDDDNSVIVGRAYLRLPVKTDGGVTFPEVVVAVEHPTGRVIDAVFAGSAGDFDAERLAASVAGSFGSGNVTVQANDADADRLAPFLPEKCMIDRLLPTLPSIKLSKAVGGKIGRIKLSYRPLKVRPTTVMQSGRDEAPSIADAKLALELACRSHNSALAKPN